VGVLRVEDRLDRVDRAGPDVTEHHAQCSDHDGQAQGLRAGLGCCLHAKIIAELAATAGENLAECRKYALILGPVRGLLRPDHIGQRRDLHCHAVQLGRRRVAS
jgi:hypothetical protein